MYVREIKKEKKKKGNRDGDRTKTKSTRKEIPLRYYKIF